MTIRSEVWINNEEMSKEMRANVISSYSDAGYKVEEGTNQTHLFKEQIIKFD